MKIGDRVGKYLITDKLGEGGMGVVFGAQHEALGRDVAIKVLHGQFAKRADLMERFWREAEAVSSIGHPNIVAVYDFGKLDDGSMYYVMERVRGETLRQRLRREPPLPRDELAAIFVQICRALAATHERGITHRDLKPDNVLLQTQHVGPPHVKLLDYGIAKVREDSRDPGLTGVGAILGTPQYMAPEQVAAAQLVDGRADLYSLGAILYEVFTGQPPFVGEPIKVMMSQMKDPVVPVETRAKRELSTAMASLIMRSLDKQPEGRPPSALEFSIELEKALGLTPSAVPIPLPPLPSTAALPVREPAPRRRSALVVGALLAGALAIGGGLLTFRLIDDRATTRDPGSALLAATLAGPSDGRQLLAGLLGETQHPPADLVLPLCGDDNPEVRRLAALAAIGVAAGGADDKGPAAGTHARAHAGIDAALAAAEERSGGQVAIDIALARVLRDRTLPLGALETLGNQLDATSFLRLQRARHARGLVPADALYRAAVAAVRAPLGERVAALRAFGGSDPCRALAGDATQAGELRLAAALALPEAERDAVVLSVLASGAALDAGARFVAELALAPRRPESLRAVEATLRGAPTEVRARALVLAADVPAVAGTLTAVARAAAKDGELRVRLAAALALRILSATESSR